MPWWLSFGTVDEIRFLLSNLNTEITSKFKVQESYDANGISYIICNESVKVFKMCTYYSDDFGNENLTKFILEHLNIQLFELARLYHTALSKVDTSQYQPMITGECNQVNSYGTPKQPR